MKSSVRTCESYLLTQADIGTSSPDWHRSVFQGLADRLGPQSGFPCPFSRNAFKNGLLRFAFVENTSDSSYRHLGRALAEYVELSRDWNGDINTAYPLLVAFSQEAAAAQTVEEYHEFGWTVLQKLHVNRRPKRTPYRRAKGTPFVNQREAFSAGAPGVSFGV